MDRDRLHGRWLLDRRLGFLVYSVLQSGLGERLAVWSELSVGNIVCNDVCYVADANGCRRRRRRSFRGRGGAGGSHGGASVAGLPVVAVVSGGRRPVPEHLGVPETV